MSFFERKGVAVQCAEVAGVRWSFGVDGAVEMAGVACGVECTGRGGWDVDGHEMEGIAVRNACDGVAVCCG